MEEALKKCNKATGNSNSSVESDDRKDYDDSFDRKEAEQYMSLALTVARNALAVGEVPVGCVIVLPNRNGDSVVISHGANQVNATRDATRHAELVAIDRILTGGMASDALRMKPDIICRAAHGTIPPDSPLLLSQTTLADDKWINVPEDPKHWKNDYGWGSRKMFEVDVLRQCDLYVTCEPCIMCAAALARVGIRRVFFGCHNDRFGGCGSILHLHEPDALPFPHHTGYRIYCGILKDEAISLLRSFYNRENFYAPEEKRKRKDTSPTT